MKYILLIIISIALAVTSLSAQGPEQNKQPQQGVHWESGTLQQALNLASESSALLSGQYRRLREYVINSYDKLSTTAISSNAVASGNIVTDLRFWKYIKIAINLQDLSVLEKVLANKSEFDKTIGKAKIEKDLYNDLRYELNLYRRKGGNYSPANIQRAESIIQMFDPNRTTGSN